MVFTTRLSRRQFLERTTSIAAAMATPALIPQGVLASDRQPGANDRLGIAIIGAGRQGSGVLKNVMQEKDTRFVGAADVYLPRAQETCEHFGGGEAYQDYRRVLDRGDVDAIVTATPDHWRALICIHACQAHKDLYAEKPISLTIREGRLIVEAARRHNRIVQVGSQQRSNVVNTIACEYIRAGRLGAVKRVVGSNYPSPWEYAFAAQPMPEGLDWDMWCGPAGPRAFHGDIFAPRAKPGWMSHRDLSGGEMTGWGAHGLDQIQWALGMDDTTPVEVWLEDGKYVQPYFSEPHDRAKGDVVSQIPLVAFRYANGIEVALDQGNKFGAIFFCEKGKIEISRGRVTSNPPEAAAEINQRAKMPIANHVRNWLDCVKTRQRPAADVAIGHRTATFCHLGNIARWVGHPLRFDPVTETFPGDDAANAWLDRQRRKGYELPASV